MNFNAEVVINYLTELLKLEQVEDFENLPLKQDFFDMMAKPKYEWDLSVVEDCQILEIIILEKLFLSRCKNLELDDIINEFYYPHFDPVFFDPEPNPKLSIAGWINYNYGQSYEKDTDTLPPLSLTPVVSIIDILVEASPSCDELLTEYITDTFLSYRDSEDGEYERDEFFFLGEGADRMYDLSKAIREMTPHLERLANNSFEGDLPHNLGKLILEELREDFFDVFADEYLEEAYYTHPLLLIQNQLNMLTENL